MTVPACNTLLCIVKTACKRIGITDPVTVSGSSDIQIKQLMGLANEEGEEFASRYPWSSLLREATFTTLAANLQGALSTLASDGFKYIINDTIWNRSQRRPIYGGLNSQDWQLLKASPVTGPFLEYRIWDDNLYLDPVPTAGETCAFEYMSENWCENNVGSGQPYLNADDDVVRIDPKIITRGLIWRWKRSKGLSYQEDFRSYEVMVTDLMARDAGRPKLSLDGSPVERLPGILVPNGNWSL